VADAASETPERPPFDWKAYRTALAEAVKGAFGSLGSEIDGPRPDVGQVDALLDFGVLLAERARLFNLTRLTEPDEMAILHFLDSYYLAMSLRPRKKTVIDIGTGAGVPGIPLAILRPDLEVTLIDGTAKKAAFVAECIEELGLKNARALQTRAEEHLHRERYGMGVLRAAVKVPRMLEILAEKRHPLGAVCFMLGGDGPKIAKTVRPRGYRLLPLEEYRLPGQERARFLATFVRRGQRK